MHQPLRRRLKPALPLHVTVTALPGGIGFSLDLDEALARLELRELLKEAGLRGNV